MAIKIQNLIVSCFFLAMLFQQGENLTPADTGIFECLVKNVKYQFEYLYATNDQDDAILSENYGVEENEEKHHDEIDKRFFETKLSKIYLVYFKSKQIYKIKDSRKVEYAKHTFIHSV
jgi:hypothetical protein